MPVDSKLLDILACPLCKEKVSLTDDGQGLQCPECQRVYPIQDDIPIMLIEEARLEEKPS